jgi:Tfp pilus assembly protein PilV
MTRTGNKSGFQLVEAMVAMSLSLVAMGGTMSLTSWIVNGNAHSSRTSTAVTLGNDIMDELRDRRFSQISSGSDTNGMFERTWQVTTSGDTKAIDVAVSWESAGQVTRTIELSTLVASE